jgi:threonine aldolase
LFLEAALIQVSDYRLLGASCFDVWYIGSYVKLSSAVGAILVEGPNRQTTFWKRTIQWLFHQNFVLIEQMVKLLWNDSWMAPFQICVRWSRLPTKMAAKLKIE